MVHSSRKKKLRWVWSDQFNWHLCKAVFCLTISPIHLLLWAAAKGLACDFLPYVLRRGHMLVLYIVHYTHDTYICCACDLYNMCVHETNVVRRGQVLVLYIPCNIVYNIVYYTSGHMLRTGILRTWKPTLVKSLDSSDKDLQLQTHLDSLLFGGDLWQRISNDSAVNVVHISYPSRDCIASKSQR